MPELKYIFNDSEHSRELERLRAIEEVFDPASRKRLLAAGLSTGWQCLEVGAGAGSIMRWMADVVGESGRVTAVDTDTRFLESAGLSNVEVFNADVRHLDIENGTFDLVHSRYVLIHIADFDVVLQKMLGLLKPGGWIVIEEPDFSTARAIVGDKAECESVTRLNQAIFQMFANRGIDCSLGVRLPSIFQKLGLQEFFVENDVPLSKGGSGVARVMRMSAEQLAEKYVATGKVSYEDIQRYSAFSESPDSWAVYYSTVGVICRKGTI
ncbi:MAG: methyltransferase domain-containing protein [Leptolyngbyaceae cyanobacterium RU_5_1]|nr:methyltransferase domain-containing protein [Leptolyngbyaceae cyanobacterium RU_5_1]